MANGAKRFLLRKLGQCTTRSGKFIVLDAMALSFIHRDLSGPELIRLAYWGVSGERE